ncbi:hypothetical protein [Dactylosporangium darangshiense]|uniref:hypothetical protein n=1 Tax=Dactylosporangium darangshiense TaxID=579108 RepID=UPI0031E9A09A
MLARVGGDELVVLRPGIGPAGDPAAPFQRLHVAVAEPFEVHGHEAMDAVKNGTGPDRPGRHRARARPHRERRAHRAALHELDVQRHPTPSDMSTAPVAPAHRSHRGRPHPNGSLLGVE